MAEGRVPQGERYVQLNIMDMFRNRGSRSGNSGSENSHRSSHRSDRSDHRGDHRSDRNGHRSDNRSGHRNSNSNGTSSRGEASATHGGPIRNRHSSSSRHASGSGPRGEHRRDRSHHRDRTQERAGYTGPARGQPVDVSEEDSIEESSQNTDVEMVDEAVFYQGSSSMLRAGGSARRAFSTMSQLNAAKVVRECATISRAVFSNNTRGYLYNGLDIKPLGRAYCPGYTLPAGDKDAGQVGCRIKVVNEDTLVCAQEMVKRHNFEQSQIQIAMKQGNAEPAMYHVDNGVVCLNMANKNSKGGGFLNGATAQEEAVMHRSTLWNTLPRSYYPWTHTEAVYSPFVAIYKNLVPATRADATASYVNFERAQAILDASAPLKNANELQLPGPPLPEIAFISIAAIEGPPTVKVAGKEDYVDDNDRALMALKIRQTLRMAALNGHRRLVLGALGCGVFRNPKEVVAEMFLIILREPEFQGGWWKEIIFACYDVEVTATSNISIFKSILDDEIV
ncbi:hypothetical protein ABW20_dc0108656 [Dactylellina cionopaga]|nr:hypothetical protein ABW20_dc0108656 [Dactylellina cionopaga]